MEGFIRVRYVSISTNVELYFVLYN